MSRQDIVGSGLHSSQDTSDIVVDRKAACEEAEKDPRKVIMGTTPSGLYGQDDSVCVYWSQPAPDPAKPLKWECFNDVSRHSYRWHLGCILLKTPAVSLLTGHLRSDCRPVARGV